MSHLFNRRASQSSLLRDTDSVISATVAEPRNLAFPRDLKSVKKAGHTTIPSRVPAHDASQDEVRYFLYMLLTLKELSLYKNGPQWILETVLSWEGDGSVLRSKSLEELESLCPMQRGMAGLDPKKNKLVEMAPPGIRSLIGNAVSTFVKRKLAREGLKKEVKESWEASMARPSSRLSMATVPENVVATQTPPSLQKNSIRYAASAHSLNVPSMDLQCRWSHNTYQTLPVAGQAMSHPYHVATPSHYVFNPLAVPNSTPNVASSSSVSSTSASHGPTICASPRSTSTLQTSPPSSDTESQIKPLYPGSCSSENVFSSEFDRVSLTSISSRDLGKKHEPASRYRGQSHTLSTTSSQQGIRHAHSHPPSSLHFGFQTMDGSLERPPLLKHNTTGHIYQASGVDDPSLSTQQYLRHYEPPSDIGFDHRRRSSPYSLNQEFHEREPQQDVRTQMLAHRKTLPSSGYSSSRVQQSNAQTSPKTMQPIKIPNWSSNSHGKICTQPAQDFRGLEVDENSKSPPATIRQVARKDQFSASISSNISAKSDVATVSAEKRSIANRIMNSFSRKGKPHVPQVEACVSSTRPVNNCKVDAYALNRAQFVMFKSQPSQARTDVVELEKERKGYIKSASTSDLYDKGLMHSMVRERADDPSNAIRPAVQFTDARTGRRKQTLYQVLEEREYLDGKTQKGQDHPDWRGFH